MIRRLWLMRQRLLTLWSQMLQMLKPLLVLRELLQGLPQQMLLMQLMNQSRYLLRLYMCKECRWLVR
jgi:hypothetical protein